MGLMLKEIFTPAKILINLESTEKDEAFAEILENMISSQPQINRSEAMDALEERESKMSTGILPGIAVPHTLCKSVKGLEGAIAISKEGIDYDSLDKKLVHIVFMFLFEPGETEKHLKLMKELASILQSPDFYTEIMSQTTAQGVYEAICRFEQNLDLI